MPALTISCILIATVLFWGHTIAAMAIVLLIAGGFVVAYSILKANNTQETIPQSSAQTQNINLPNLATENNTRSHTSSGAPYTRATADGNEGLLSSALIIDEPWISMILSGKKCWEMRSSAVAKRGKIALIRKGSKTIVGVAHIADCIGPLDDQQISASFSKHKVPVEKIGKWRYAWVLTNIKALPHAQPYTHPKGAVIWVNLDRELAKRISNITF